MIKTIFSPSAIFSFISPFKICFLSCRLMNMPWYVNFLWLIRRGKRILYFWDCHSPCVPVWTIRISCLCLLMIPQVRCGKLKWDVFLWRTPALCNIALPPQSPCRPNDCYSVHESAYFLNWSFLMRQHWPLKAVAILNYFCVLQRCVRRNILVILDRVILYPLYFVHNYCLPFFSLEILY